jgi:hypothetical protein
MLPWNRPRLADLPEEQRLKAKALMLGAVAGHSGHAGRLEILRDDDDEGKDDDDEGKDDDDEGKDDVP